jgi:hypothetical protein
MRATCTLTSSVGLRTFQLLIFVAYSVNFVMQVGKHLKSKGVMEKVVLLLDIALQ